MINGVLFVQPNASGKIYQDLSKDFSAIEPPIWGLLLANSIKKKGFRVELLDAEVLRISAEKTAKLIKEINFKLICIVVYGQNPQASTQSMHGVSDLLKELNLNYPEFKTILVGLYPSALPIKTMKDEMTDFVCQGEGLYTLLELLKVTDLNNQLQLENVGDLWFRDENGNIKNTFQYNLIEDLDNELPGFDWSMFNPEKYRTTNHHAFFTDMQKSPFVSFYTSLGCPYNCTFCCINAPFGNNNEINSGIRGKSFRYWSPEFIITEFEKAANFGITNIKIADEMFVYNPKHFLKLSELIKDRDYKFNLWAYSRIDTVKEKYLETLKQANFNYLALGIESGNRKVRTDVIKGKFEEFDIKDIVGIIHKYGIEVIANYIFGLPEDTLETMQETFDLSIELKTFWANYYCAMAYPGSKLYLDAIINKLELPKTYSGYSQHSIDSFPLNTKYISNREVLQFRDNAFINYYDTSWYKELIYKKFGDKALQDINNMLKFKLERNLLK